MVNGQISRVHVLQHQDVINIGDWSIEVLLPQSAARPMMLLAEEKPDADVENLAADLEMIRTGTEKILAEVAKRIVGQKQVVRLVWATILARGHCLLLGVPGLAKTYVVLTFAETLGIHSNRIQFTPDLMPSDIIGTRLLQEDEDGKRIFDFVQGPVFTQLLLADEINRTPPKTQAALLEAMQERHVTVANKAYNLPRPFCVVATQNPIEQEGTYPLPEAQQDRFLLCINVEYPDRDEEIRIILETTLGRIPDVAKILDADRILRFQKVVDNIAVSREAACYAADLSRATRPGPDSPLEHISEMIDWGAGPRAGQALVRTAKALAAMDGRPAVSVDDIMESALPVMRHRIGYNYRARAKGLNADDLINRLLQEVKCEA
jgi:MoxR-like ATPase